jgi:hypothetical protein
MNKTMLLHSCTIRTVFLSSLIVSAGFLSLPSSSMADEQKFYRNCAELQKVINGRNPTLTLRGFERVQMMRRNLTDYAGNYILLCNSGTIIDREEGTICRGYIGYSYAPHVSGADYYARWGKADGTPNINDTGQEKYCRRIK